MKQLLLLCAVLACTAMASAQVGVGTTAPDAQLDVRASNPTNPANTDGLLVPKLATFPLANPTFAQQGMLVYLTTTTTFLATTRLPGFYYWNNPTADWIPLGGATEKDHDWYEEGTTEAPDAITDRMYHTGNVAIGKDTADYPLEVQNNTALLGVNVTSDFSSQVANAASINNTVTKTNTAGNAHAVSNMMTVASTASAVTNVIDATAANASFGVNNYFLGTGADVTGMHTQIANTGNGNHLGVATILSGTGNGNQYGVKNSFTGGGNGNRYGLQTDMNAPGIGNHYGVSSTLNGNGNGIHYGLASELGGSGAGTQYGTMSSLTNSGNAEHYGNYNTLSGNGSGGHMGTHNTLFGNGTGQHFGVYNSVTSGGSGNHYGTHNYLDGTGTGSQMGVSTQISNSSDSNHYGMSNLLNGVGTGAHYGIMSSLSGTGTGGQIGLYNLITNTGGGTHYGSSLVLTGTGSGLQYGNYTTIDNSGNSEHYASYNYLSGTGSGTKYGSYNRIFPTAGGTNFGVYSEVLKAGSNNYAGYFLGNVGIGTNTANTYTLPPSRGAYNQIMVTDGAGVVSWQNASIFSDADWYQVGTSTAPTAITDAMYHTGNVGIGQTIANYRLDVLSAARTINSVTTSNNNAAVLGFNTAVNASTNLGHGVAGQTSQNSSQGARGEQLSNIGYGAAGINFAALGTGSGGGVYGQTMQSAGFGIDGRNTNGSGTGVIGSGNSATGNYLVLGSGGAFTGVGTGAYARSTTAGAGEGLYTDQFGAIVRVNHWSGTTQYKILGVGTVSTTAEDTQGNRVVLHASEAPEIYLEDHGSGQLTGGRAHISIDPIIAKNITVNEKHPLRVYVQLEDDCNGVFVTNKTGNSFDVVELSGGQSNARFLYHIVGNRADELLPNGRISKNADVRFEPAPRDLETATVKTVDVGKPSTKEPETNH